MLSKRGMEMNIVKLAVLTAIVIAVFLTASCGIKDGGDVPSTSAPTTVINSVAVSVFYPITEEYGTEEVEESLYESSTYKEETSTMRFVSPTTEKTTKKAEEIISTTVKLVTTKATTQATRQTVKVTINEGDSLTQIFKKLDENGVADFDALMETAQTYDYSYYPLVAKIPSSANRCFKLEGYLFPDTYEFYTNQKPQDAIGKFLRNGKAKITDSMMSQASALGYSMDEVLTVASIIEKEGANSKEVAKIAAVIYNRLEAGMKLQMDSTIYYIERNVKPYLTGDINRYNSYYNTYKCSALPAGPISNPGMTTIKAALNPADSDYLYFCHDGNANYYYAETYEEHQENLKLAGI